MLIGHSVPVFFDKAVRLVGDINRVMADRERGFAKTRFLVEFLLVTCEIVV